MGWLFVPNEPGIDEVMRGPEMAEHLTMAAQAGRAAVQPRGANRKGDIVAEPARTRDGVMSARFGSTSSFWHLEEFGSINNRPYRTLTTAALTLGLRFEASR
jgi:hypothetical protein